MTERARNFMNAIWDCRNNQGADGDEVGTGLCVVVAAQTD